MWLLLWEDFFNCNSWAQKKEVQRMQYTLSRMDWKEVAPFALTYQKQMTGELGYTKHKGYEL